jgi:hypothetical protein
MHSEQQPKLWPETSGTCILSITGNVSGCLFLRYFSVGVANAAAFYIKSNLNFLGPEESGDLSGNFFDK